MKNIEKFKKLHYYGPNGEMTREEVEKIGMKYDAYESLDESAYQCAYDLSNDWAKEIPDWDDVQIGYKQGAKDGIKYMMEKVKKLKLHLITCIADADEKELFLYKDAEELILSYINKLFNEEEI